MNFRKSESVSKKDQLMSKEAVTSPRREALGGVLFLFIYTIIISLIAKQFVSEDSLLKGIGVTAIVSAIVYFIIVKLLHFDNRKKMCFLAILVIILDIGGVSLGRYFYWSAPSMPEAYRVLKGIETIIVPEKMKEQVRLKNTIRILTESIKTKPENTSQVIEYMNDIEKLFILHKNYYDLSKNFHEQILALISSVKTVQDQKKVEEVLLDKALLNISALKAFREQHDKWYETLIACLNARKVYYLSLIKHESTSKQDYLRLNWLDLEDVCTRERTILDQINVWYPPPKK